MRAYLWPVFILCLGLVGPSALLAACTDTPQAKAPNVHVPCDPSALEIPLDCIQNAYRLCAKDQECLFDHMQECAYEVARACLNQGAGGA